MLVIIELIGALVLGAFVVFGVKTYFFGNRRKRK
jgi:Tfp pilus assembly protein PilW